MPLERSLEEFCRREYPRLVGALTLYTGQADMAREIAHEALGRACARWSRLQRLNNPGGWVARSAMRLASARRVGKPRPVVPAGARDKGIPGRAPDPGPAIRLALVRLPARQRGALLLRHYLELSAFEAAELMECDARTVRKLTRRAIDTLKRDPEVERHLEVADAP